jgi:hypothetical protein
MRTVLVFHFWRLLRLGLFGGILLIAKNASGVLLDWDSASWTSGSLSRSFEIDSSNPGNDVTITITGNTSRLDNNTPEINQAVTGGLSPTQDSLQFYLDLHSRSESITVTITFNYTMGVDSVAFKLFDIDKNNDPGNDSVFTDQVRNIRARFNSSPYVGASVTGSSANSVSNNGATNATVTGTALSAENSGNGNASIGFGTNIVNQVTFTYGSSSANPWSDPSVEWISLHDISFRRVPEMSTAAILGGGCLAFLVLVIWRQWRHSPADPRKDS